MELMQYQTVIYLYYLHPSERRYALIRFTSRYPRADSPSARVHAPPREVNCFTILKPIPFYLF